MNTATKCECEECGTRHCDATAVCAYVCGGECLRVDEEQEAEWRAIDASDRLADEGYDAWRDEQEGA